jgi:hypothetical protein
MSKRIEHGRRVEHGGEGRTHLPGYRSTDPHLIEREVIPNDAIALDVALKQ